MAKRDTPRHVDRYTRAPQEGRLIYCPKCSGDNRVYNFSWCGITCQDCWQLVDKGDWLLGRPEAPKDMPPRFVVVRPDTIQLLDSNSEPTGIQIVQVADSDTYTVIDKAGQRATLVKHLAYSKDMAMHWYKE